MENTGFRKAFRTHASKKSQADADVTVILYPFERFSSFPNAVADLYKNTTRPFHLIVVEGNAPDSVRSALESIERPDFTVVYTSFYPTAAEAINLALPHVKTPYVFVTDNDSVVHESCIDHLAALAKESAGGWILPVMMNDPEEPFNFENGGQHAPAKTDRLRIRNFMASAEMLSRIGKFDENVATIFSDMDLSLTAKQLNAGILIEPRAQARYRLPMPLKALEARLFERQWDPEQLEASRKHMQKKWKIRIRPDIYRRILTDKHQSLIQSKSSTQPASLGHLLQAQLEFARQSFKKILEPLNK